MVRKARILFLMIAVIFLSSPAFSQSPENGAFGAPVFKYTRMAGQPALIMGGKGGWIINKRIVLGAGYYTLTSKINSDFTDEQYNQNLLLDFNYGGLDFEYLLFYESKYNLTISMFLGSGGLNFHLKDNSKKFSNRNLLVWEPQLNFEMELYSWFHADMGVSYRMISAYTEVYDISMNDLRGINVLLTFKFGRY
jgi:hypothetical protein